MAPATRSPASRSTSGGNDTITLIPDGNLKANTEYKFEITDGVKDLNGVPFMPYSATFTTGTTDVFNPPGVYGRRRRRCGL